MEPGIRESRDPWSAKEFLGVARVPIATLDFDHHIFRQQHRPVSEKVVERLREVFRREGCQRYESRNWVDALVDCNRFEAVLAQNGLSRKDLHPESENIRPLDFGPVECLQGVHRIAAASNFLNENDRWWTVRLYSRDLSKATCTKIIEGSLNEQPYPDGEIFRKIRIYHKQGDKKAEDKWWARLTPTKQKDLRQLLKNVYFAQAFDDLVVMPGLWHSVKLGTLHRLLTLRCDEELLRYLRHVSRTWKETLDTSNVAAEALDRETVERLELLAPSASSKDRDLVENMFQSGEVFGTVTDEQARMKLLRGLTGLPGLIPSLRTFFENLKFLEPCCKILKELLSPKDKRSIQQSFSGAYFCPSEQLVEHSEGRKKRKSTTDDKQSLWLAYVQLWAFCMRHFPSMTQLAPRKELGKEKPSNTSNSALWHYLGSLAVELGFRTEKALELQQQDPHRTLAEQSLKSVRPHQPPDERLVLTVANAFKQADRGPERATKPVLTREQCLPVDRRCGRPFEDDFVEDRNSLFIPLIYQTEPSKGVDISPFFVKKDTFISFLGNHYSEVGEDVEMEDGEGDDPDSVEHVTPSETTGTDEAHTSRITELQNKIRELQDGLARAEREREELKDKHDQETNGLKCSAKAASDELLAVQQKLEKKLEEVEKLLEESERLRGSMVQDFPFEHHPGDMPFEELDIEKKANEKLKKDHDELRKEKEKLECELLRMQKSISDEEARRENFKMREAELEGQQNVAREAAEQMETKKQQLENNVLRLQLELSTAQQNATTVIEALNAENQELKARGSKLTSDLSEAQKNLSAAKKKVKMVAEKAQRTIGNLQDALTDQKTLTAAANEELSKLQPKLEAALNELISLKNAAFETSKLHRRIQSSSNTEKSLRQQLKRKKETDGFVGIFEASLNGPSREEQLVGTFQIITPTAIFAVKVPILHSTSVIERLLQNIHDADSREPWEICFTRQGSVLKQWWKTDFIEKSLEKHRICIAGPERTIRAVKEFFNSGTDRREGLTIDSNVKLDINALATIQDWVGGAHSGKKRRIGTDTANLEPMQKEMRVIEEPDNDTDGYNPSPLLRNVEGNGQTDNPTQDREVIASTEQSLVLRRQGDFTFTSQTLVQDGVKDIES